MAEVYLSSQGTTELSKNLNFETNLTSISADPVSSLKKTDSYADLYGQLINKNREIIVLKSQLGADLTRQESITSTSNGGWSFVSGNGSVTALWFKKLLNFDTNFWTVVSVILFLWLIVRPSLKSNKTAEIEEKYDGSQARDFEINRLDSLQDFESKLDLARAFMDIGDTEQSRKILESVLTSESAVHRKEAKQMLDLLGT